MSTKFLSPGWRMPRNANQSKSSNYSMDFNGGYITCDQISELNSTTAFSISVWCKLDNISGIWGDYVSNIGIKLDWNDHSGGFLQFTTKTTGSNNYLSYNVARDSNWHHIVCTYDAGVRYIYLDGVSVANDSAAPTQMISTLGDNFLIGKHQQPTSMAGQINEVSIFDYALSSSQVTTLYGTGSAIGNPMALPSPPIAYYPLGTSAWNGEYLAENNAIGDYVFDFANDKIEVDNIGNLFSGITNFSFSGWFNLTSFGSQQVFNILEGNNWKFGINTFNNQLRFNVNPGIAYISNLQNITSTNTWFHYAGVFDGSGASDTDRLKLYINGQPQTVTYNTTTPTSFPTLLSTADISIGGTLSPFTGMTGKASNIQLWTSSLTPSEVETLYNYGSPIRTLANIPQNSNLQGWWKLNASDTYDSSTGNWTIEDHVGSNDGTSSGMSQANLVQSDLQTVAPYSKYAMDFDAASNNKITASANSNLDTGDLSASIWVYSTNLGNNIEYFFGNSNALAVAGFTFAINSSNGYAWYIGRATTTHTYVIYNVNINFTNNVWNHLCFSYDDTTKGFILYLNGASVNSGTATSITKNASGSIKFGGHNPQYDFTGKLSNASIWNTALTSAQVTEIYNQGLPGNLNSHSAYSNLVSWWQLGENSSFDGNDWIVADEKGTNNGTSTGMPVGALVNGVGTTANGVSSGMSEGNLVGDAPYSTANAISTNMVVTSRVSGSGNTP